MRKKFAAGLTFIVATFAKNEKSAIVTSSPANQSEFRKNDSNFSSKICTPSSRFGRSFFLPRKAGSLKEVVLKEIMCSGKYRNCEQVHIVVYITKYWHCVATLVPIHPLQTVIKSQLSPVQLKADKLAYFQIKYRLRHWIVFQEMGITHFRFRLPVIKITGAAVQNSRKCRFSRFYSGFTSWTKNLHNLKIY